MADDRQAAALDLWRELDRLRSLVPRLLTAWQRGAGCTTELVHEASQCLSVALLAGEFLAGGESVPECPACKGRGSLACPECAGRGVL